MGSNRETCILREAQRGVASRSMHNVPFLAMLWVVWHILDPFRQSLRANYRQGELIMRIFTNLIGAAVGVIFRMFTIGLLTGIVGAGAVIGIAHVYGGDPHWPPTILTDVSAVLVGLLSAYAGGTTTILRALVRGTETAVKDVEKDVKSV